MANIQAPRKPLLRGVLHQEAFFMALGACILLVVRGAESLRTEALSASLIYSLGLLSVFGISAVYHRPHWEPKPRALMKRLDHSAIFILVAGTITPLCFLALPADSGRHLFTVIWFVAALGILQSIFWVRAPKWFTSLFYVGMGLLASPYMQEAKISLGSANLALLESGGVIYALGAVFYAMKRPKLVAHIFGYHELFHLLTIIAAALHFAVIYQLL